MARRLFTVLLVCLVMAAPSAAGTIRGKLVLVEKGGRKASDLSDAVVYLDGPKLRTAGATATVVMKAKTFSPHVVVIPVGSTVDFPNQDPIFHNVFSVSAENRFDLDLYKRPKSGQWTFKAPGVARVYCNIHPQMSAVILVRDNPYFSKAEPDGSFVLADVPGGKYTLKAWHERASEASLELTVAASGETDAGELVFDSSGYRRLPHKKKDGTDYGSDEKY